MQSRRKTQHVKLGVLLMCFGLIFNSCTSDSNEAPFISDPKEEEIIQNFDSDAQGDCKTIEMTITSGDIIETYQIEYNAEGKITQAIGSNGKYTFSHSPNAYSYKNYSAAGVLTNTKEVQLNSDGKPITYTEEMYDENEEVYREEKGTLTYSEGKIAELEITFDDFPIKVYKMFWKDGNVSEIEYAGYIDRKYEYHTDVLYPQDGLICLDLIGYLQTGIYYMGDNNTHLLKHSEVDGVIADFTYTFNDHGKIVSQKSVQNNIANPIYFTPSYSCE